MDGPEARLFRKIEFSRIKWKVLLINSVESKNVNLLSAGLITPDHHDQEKETELSRKSKNNIKQDRTIEFSR